MVQLIEVIVKVLIRFVFGVLFVWTGEIVLFLVSLGKHKPRWGFYAEETPFRFVLFSEISQWIGVAFWLLAIAAFWYFGGK